MNTDVDAVVYLMLVNNLLHDVFPTSITIGGCWWLVPCWSAAYCLLRGLSSPIASPFMCVGGSGARCKGRGVRGSPSLCAASAGPSPTTPSPKP